MSEKLCGTCKYFGKDEGPHVWKPMPNERGWCGRITETWDRLYDDNEDPALMIGREYANLAVLPTFGCVLWEKEETDDE
jgi:hypothetical protein